MARSRPAGALILAAGALAAAAAAAVWLAVDPVGEAEHADRRAPHDPDPSAAASPAAGPSPAAAPPPTRDAPATGSAHPAPGAAAGIGSARNGARPPGELVAALARVAVAPDELLGLPATRPRPSAERGGTWPPAGLVTALALTAFSVDDLLGSPSAAPRPAPPSPAPVRAQSPSAAAPEPAAAAAAPELVAGVQRDLTRRGYAPGPVDGRLGPRTRAAIRAFQRTAGLAVDGEPSAVLLARLRAGGDGTEAAAAGEPRPAGRDGGAGRADGWLQPRATDVINGVLPRVLAITGDEELAAIVARRDLDRRR